MEKSKEILKLGFSIIGYDLFSSSSSPNIGYLIRRFLMFGSHILLTFVFMWTIFQSPEIGVKVFNINTTCICFIVWAQSATLLTFRQKIAFLIKDIINTVNNGWTHFAVFESELFEKCKRVILRSCQATAAGVCANMSMIILTPIVTTSKFAYPAEFRFDKEEKWNFAINTINQILGSLYIATFFSFFSLIFIFLTVGVLYKLKVVAALCKVIGRNQSNDSNDLLKVIHDFHLKALNFVYELNEIFNVPILLWEACMIMASCMYYVLSLVEPTRMISFTPASSICVFQYFIVSLLSTLVKDALHDVAMKLYESEWYKLPPKTLKDMLLVMAMSQRTKSLQVWSLSEASLERFTRVLNLVYKINLAIKFMVNSY
ncbi:uncharacterized protein LOC134828522 [Culicoides brevitarsis]|uniref:uncharacterized protein LOC134828522 n=1 Tax=Culicoides brevitarsis TaxID=469753 RepID=UPI00307B8B3E